MNDSGFACTLCGTPVGDRYHCFDRRTESLVLTEQDGKVITTEHIASCQVMFIYCSAFCWDIHEPTVAAELQISKPYPPGGLITPCSRCGNPVTGQRLTSAMQSPSCRTHKPSPTPSRSASTTGSSPSFARTAKRPMPHQALRWLMRLLKERPTSDPIPSAKE